MPVEYERAHDDAAGGHVHGLSADVGGEELLPIR